MTAAETKSGADFAATRQAARSCAKLAPAPASSLASGTPDSVYHRAQSAWWLQKTRRFPRTRTMVELLYPGDIIAPSLQPLTPGLSYTTMSATELWRDPAQRHEIRNGQRSRRSPNSCSSVSICSAPACSCTSPCWPGLPSEQRVAACCYRRPAGSAPTPAARSRSTCRCRATRLPNIWRSTPTRCRGSCRGLVREGVLARSSRAQITIRDLDALKAHCPLSAVVLALHTED